MKTASSEVIPATPGTSFAGGIFLGRLFSGAEAYAIVAAPKSEGELKESTWSASRKMVEGAQSVYDGAANTAAMAEAASALAKWAQDLRIGGFDDWYLPARGELLLAFAAGLQGDEAFERAWYWSSTQFDDRYPECAWYQTFDGGNQNAWLKDGKGRARAVRRVKIT